MTPEEIQLWERQIAATVAQTEAINAQAAASRAATQAMLDSINAPRAPMAESSAVFTLLLHVCEREPDKRKAFDEAVDLWELFKREYPDA